MTPGPADSAEKPPTRRDLLNSSLQALSPNPASLPHPEHLCRLPGGHIVLSPQGQVLLVLLAVHLLMDGLRQSEELEVTRFPKGL